MDIDDIIWMGPQPSVASKGALIGCSMTAPLAEFDKAVAEAVAKGRPVHFLPPARYYNQMKLSQLTGLDTDVVRNVGPGASSSVRCSRPNTVSNCPSTTRTKRAA